MFGYGLRHHRISVLPMSRSSMRKKIGIEAYPSEVYGNNCSMYLENMHSILVKLDANLELSRKICLNVAELSNWKSYGDVCSSI